MQNILSSRGSAFGRLIIWLSLWLSLCIIFSVLSGCSSLMSAKPQAQQLTARSYHPQITMAGRLSAQYQTNGQPQSIYINFSWAQTEQQTFITLGSPTGQTLATILINSQGATFTQADKPARFATDVNQLFGDMLGWPMPVAGLRDWLQGYIDEAHTTPISEATAALPFSVAGWSLRYASWETENNVERPKRLDLSRQTEQAGLVTLRIVVNERTLP